MDKNMARCIKGFFYSLLLTDFHHSLKEMNVIPPSYVYTFMKEVRKKEMEQLIETDFWRFYQEKIKENISFVQAEPYFSEESMKECMEYFFVDYHVWNIFLAIYMEDDLFSEKQIHLHQKEVLDQALEKGNGVILAQSLWGLSDILAPAMMKKNYSIWQVYEKETDGLFYQKVREEYCSPWQKEKFHTLFATEPSSYDTLIQSLKQNDIVVIPMDSMEIPESSRQELLFFGHKIEVSKKICMVASRSQAPIIFVRVENKENELHLYFDGPIYVQSNQEIEQKNVILFRQLEEHVKKKPNQWRGWFLLEQFLLDDGNRLLPS